MKLRSGACTEIRESKIDTPQVSYRHCRASSSPSTHFFRFTAFCQLPSLPLELIVTVAEFLAGDHAFSTLVALHSINRLVRDETSAILYETLFFDNVKKTWACHVEGTVERNRWAKYAK
jgi:hypothetical protein